MCLEPQNENLKYAHVHTHPHIVYMSVCVYIKSTSKCISKHIFVCFIFVLSEKQQQKGIIFIFVFWPHSSSGNLVSLTFCRLWLEQLESWRTTLFVDENSVETVQWNFLHNCEFDSIWSDFSQRWWSALDLTGFAFIC